MVFRTTQAFWQRNEELFQLSAFLTQHAYHARYLSLKDYVAEAVRKMWIICSEIKKSNQSSSLCLMSADEYYEVLRHRSDRLIKDSMRLISDYISSFLSFNRHDLEPSKSQQSSHLDAGKASHRQLSHHLLDEIFHIYPVDSRVQILAKYLTHRDIRSQDDFLMNHANGYIRRKLDEVIALSVKQFHSKSSTSIAGSDHNISGNMDNSRLHSSSISQEVAAGVASNSSMPRSNDPLLSDRLIVSLSPKEDDMAEFMNEEGNIAKRQGFDKNSIHAYHRMDGFDADPSSNIDVDHSCGIHQSIGNAMNQRASHIITRLSRLRDALTAMASCSSNCITEDCRESLKKHDSAQYEWFYLTSDIIASIPLPLLEFFNHSLTSHRDSNDRRLSWDLKGLDQKMLRDSSMIRNQMIQMLQDLFVLVTSMGAILTIFIKSSSPQPSLNDGTYMHLCACNPWIGISNVYECILGNIIHYDRCINAEVEDRIHLKGFFSIQIAKFLISAIPHWIFIDHVSANLRDLKSNHGKESDRFDVIFYVLDHEIISHESFVRILTTLSRRSASAVMESAHKYIGFKSISKHAYVELLRMYFSRYYFVYGLELYQSHLETNLWLNDSSIVARIRQNGSQELFSLFSQYL